MPNSLAFKSLKLFLLVLLSVLSVLPVMAQVGTPSQVVKNTPCWQAAGDEIAKPTGCFSTAGAAIAELIKIGSVSNTVRRVTLTVIESPDADGVGYFNRHECFSYDGGATCGYVPDRKTRFVVTLTPTGPCPDGSTPDSSGVCYCNATTKPNAAKDRCDKKCDPNITVSSGYYDIGTNQNASPALLSCKDKCEVVFDGESPAGSSSTDNVKTWYAKGSYITTGNTCAGSNPKEVGSALPNIPTDKCSTGMQQGTFNGKLLCIKPQGDDGSGGTPAPTPTPTDTTTTTKDTTVNADGSTTTKETSTTVNSGGGTTTSTTTTVTKPDGSSTSTTVVVRDPGTVPGTKPTDPDKPEEKGRCEKNPSEKGCGGEPSGVSSSYASKGTAKTFASTLQAHADTLKKSRMGAAVSSFFSVSGGGTCPRFTGVVPYLEVTVTFDQFCTSLGQTALLVMRSVILLVFSFFAFRVAIE